MAIADQISSYKYILAYEKRYRKRIASKPQVVQILALRSFNTAATVLALLEGMSFQDIAKAVFLYCKDSKFREITKQYEGQIELAGANPERFLLELHSFYNQIGNLVRKNNLYTEFADYMGSYLEYYHELIECSTGPTKQVITAFTNLLLQTAEYIRPNKFDLHSCFLGVSTTGIPIVGKQPYAFADLPALEIREEISKGKRFPQEEYNNRVVSGYHKHGYDINSLADVELLEEMQRVQTNTYSTLMPYINEYTSDILPQEQFYCRYAPLQHCNVKIPFADIAECLKARKRTLPANGTKIAVTDPTSEIRGMLLKEIAIKDSVILLYRMTTEYGDISGYFNTKSGFFHSVAREAEPISIHENIRSFVLYCYALCVTNIFKETDEVVFNCGKPVNVKTYGIGGKLKAVHNASYPEGPRRADDDRYSAKTTAINGFIRTLPEEHHASPEAVELARSMGYELEPNETYVRAFCKTIFVRKENPHG